jgi:hypothetical protein
MKKPCKAQRTQRAGIEVPCRNPFEDGELMQHTPTSVPSAMSWRGNNLGMRGHLIHPSHHQVLQLCVLTTCTGVCVWLQGTVARGEMPSTAYIPTQCQYANRLQPTWAP